VGRGAGCTSKPVRIYAYRSRFRCHGGVYPVAFPSSGVTDGMYLKYWIFNFEIEDVIIPLNINPNPRTLLYPIFEKNKKYFFATKKAELWQRPLFVVF